uniref:Uncharacterized protein n=1 Tax=Morchella importuna TaxID=1174673 RepID=A0A650AFA3_9PEZI|nr:hypothetical protein [Morchella importuna]QGN66713.1 hypothetical protein [Morchella importuna]
MAAPYRRVGFPWPSVMHLSPFEPIPCSGPWPILEPFLVCSPCSCPLFTTAYMSSMYRLRKYGCPNSAWSPCMSLHIPPVQPPSSTFYESGPAKQGEGFILEVLLGLYRTNRSACRRFYFFNLKKMNFLFLSGAKEPSVRFRFGTFTHGMRPRRGCMQTESWICKPCMQPKRRGGLRPSLFT